ncbi:hypothetical protein [Fibrella forsythiae]|uniref:Bacterial Pleckstrin homology domain-containing protein n=1 Tax=Fibrella forsythiae TaxID=2817061 RepID=A0ABS3JID7_9BACT|nr:hypothetical protein [Fibrella forsythiae]MBO0949776.1 hypothetical protein [Fibrella forsythiae]
MSSYKETQRMNYRWLLLLLVISLGGGTWVLVEQIGFGHPIGDKPATNTELLFIALFPASIVIFVLAFSLTTDVTAEGIRLRYFPIWSTSVKWHEVKYVQIINYGFVGYGVRFTAEYGTVYNAKGNVGLLVQKTDGSRLLIGTQRPEELLAAVNQHLNVPA